MAQLRVGQGLGHVVDRRDAGVDAVEEREPVGGGPRAEVGFERRDRAGLLPALGELEGDQFLAPERAQTLAQNFGSRAPSARWRPSRVS